MHAADASGAGEAHRYGGFEVGRLNLALPLHALREVLPRDALQDLPCPDNGVVGGLDLRGRMLPVISMHRMLGRPTPDHEPGCVVVIGHEGRLVGLLSDSVSGIFDATDAHRANEPCPTDAPQDVLVGAVRRVDDGQLVSVLSPAVLTGLPGLPMCPDAQDTEPTSSSPPDDDTPRPTVLLRCGSMHFALDAMAVQTTLLAPPVMASPLAHGPCVGVIEHAGHWVAAVDLPALCGLQALAPEQRRQAIVLQDAQGGRVALLIEAVLDVVPLPSRSAVAAPPFALPRPDLIPRVLAAQALPLDDTPAQHILFLAFAALAADPLIQALATTNTPSTSTSQGRQAGPTSALVSSRDTSQVRAPSTPQLTVLSYTAGSEFATPIDQVAEILPFQSTWQVQGTGDEAAHVVVHRDRAIGLVCLATMLGLPGPADHHGAFVLVVPTGANSVGFVVSRLTAIETTQGEYAVRGLGPSRSTSPAAPGRALRSAGSSARRTHAAPRRPASLGPVAAGLGPRPRWVS